MSDDSIECAVSTTSSYWDEPTAYIKFIDGKLHQAWTRHTMEARIIDWRPVESESSKPAIRKET